MNHSFSVYMSNKEKIKKLKDDKFETKLTRGISIFFILSLSWFGYSMYKVILELF